jgi:hypothetical protein
MCAVVAVEIEEVRTQGISTRAAGALLGGFSPHSAGRAGILAAAWSLRRVFLSFFDEADEPRRPRPRRPAPGAMAAAPDPRTARIRQAVAAGVVVLVIILLVVGIRGCLNSAKLHGLRDYNSNVAALVQASDDQVSKPLFEALGGGGAASGDTVNLQTQVNQLRIVADEQLTRAQKLDVPGDMQAAQRSFVLVLQLRRDGLARIAEKLPTAQATGAASQTAIIQITGQMQQFLASDVVYSQQVQPLIARALADNGIHGERVRSGQFFPSIQWLDASQVANRLGGTLTSVQPSGPVASGTHGHGLTSVSVNGQDLATDSANRITAAPNLTFTVNFANQGDNDEHNVVVKVSIDGAGTPVVGETTVPQTSAGSSATAEVTLRQPPPVGKPVSIDAVVEPVPGEKDVANNKASYPALFTQ